MLCREFLSLLQDVCVPDSVCVCVCVCWNGGCRIKNNLLGINLHLPGFFCPDGQRNSLRDEQRKISFLHAGKHTGLCMEVFRETYVCVCLLCLSHSVYEFPHSG